VRPGPSPVVHGNYVVLRAVCFRRVGRHSV
jgi:hypothetical protein